MPEFPQFDAEYLGTLTDSFRSRSKAITGHAKGWTISREIDGEYERFIVDADGFHGQLRLSVYNDGSLWLRLCRGRPKNGWKFLLTFHGNRGNLETETIVEQFINSMAYDTADTLLLIWGNVDPVVERSESKA